MATVALPFLKLTLTPNFSILSGAADSLSATLTLQNPRVVAGGVLFVFDQIAGRDVSPSVHSAESGLAASDDDGDLVLRVVQVDGSARHLYATRHTAGDVILKLHVIPLIGCETRAAGVQPGLRMDHGGLMGVGRSFLPRPPDIGITQYRNVVEWDLSDAPAGTRAIWSFGEGPGPIVRDGPASVLLDSVYMVGPVQSHPPEPVVDPGASFCGTYWFGELPPNLDALKDFSSEMFPRMSAHFRDVTGSYRLFLRKVQGCLAGLTCAGSSVVDYAEDTKTETDWDLVRLLNHHMVRSWIGLDPEDDGFDNDWFSRGWAQIYSVFLPFRFGQRTPDYFRATINAFLTAYYTNPRKTISLRDTETISSDWYARQIPDMRGCIYMLKMDFFTRRASKARGDNVMRPIDGVLAEISVNRRQGQRVQTRHWLQYLAHWLGPEAAEKYFEDFMDGTGEILEMGDLTASFGDKDSPVAVEQEVLDLGMDPESFDTRVVSGLVPGSRAELAGLQNGDKILWNSRLGACVTNFDRKLTIAVERGEREAEIEYWPRAWTKAPSWQVMRIAGGD